MPGGKNPVTRYSGIIRKVVWSTHNHPPRVVANFPREDVRAAIHVQIVFSLA